MSDLENRVKKLEQRSEGEGPKAAIVYIYDGKSEAEAEAAKQKAIAEYKEKHPDWESSSKDWYIQVTSKHAKELTERLIAGERTG